MLDGNANILALEGNKDAWCGYVPIALGQSGQPPFVLCDKRSDGFCLGRGEGFLPAIGLAGSRTKWDVNGGICLWKR